MSKIIKKCNFQKQYRNNGKIINSQNNPFKAANIFSNNFVNLGEEYNKISKIYILNVLMKYVILISIHIFQKELKN